MLTKGGLLFLGSDDAIRVNLGVYEYRFTWRTRSADIRVNDAWEGDLWRALARAKGHFSSCNAVYPITFQDETYQIPHLDRVAFHEAYLNALVHRDYSQDGMISVVYADGMMEIVSPGGFHGDVSPENIFIHDPRHRNKALAKLLMLYHLVDRAGVGVLRMGIHSLIYGRRFPEFQESEDSVHATMHAETIRPGVFVLTAGNSEDSDLTELLVLNSLYSVGYVSVERVIGQPAKLTRDPWADIQNAVTHRDEIELCGDKRDVYVRIVKYWDDVFDVTKTHRVSAASGKYVLLFSYPMEHGSASNRDITGLLGRNYTSQTSGLLSGTDFVERAGKDLLPLGRLSADTRCGSFGPVADHDKPGHES